MMEVHIEARWAIWNYKERYFCGKHCWSDCPRTNAKNAPEVPTFPTRKLARIALDRMTSCRKESRPVKVTVRLAAKFDW